MLLSLLPLVLRALTMDILVVGHDRISRELLSKLGEIDGLAYVQDRTSRLRRVAKLLRRRSLGLGQVADMLIAELRRPNFPQSVTFDSSIDTNAELADLITQHRPNRVYLFRAGLIVNRKVLELGVEIANFHCASIETHGGLGAIHRALDDGQFAQTATLHKVTTTIDSGEILDKEAYTLDPSRSYFWNEQVAYDAGIRLALRNLKKPAKAS